MRQATTSIGSVTPRRPARLHIIRDPIGIRDHVLALSQHRTMDEQERNLHLVMHAAAELILSSLVGRKVPCCSIRFDVGIHADAEHPTRVFTMQRCWRETSPCSWSTTLPVPPGSHVTSFLPNSWVSRLDSLLHVHHLCSHVASTDVERVGEWIGEAYVSERYQTTLSLARA